MSLSPEEASALTLLLKAQSKNIVLGVCKEGFVHRNGKVPELVIATTAKSLDIQPAEAQKLFQAVSHIIRTVLYEGISSAPSIAELFPADFHENLKGLLAGTIAKCLPEWKSQTLKNEVSLPRLVDFDWRVDMKAASDSVNRMTQPTCLVQLKVEDAATSTQEIPRTKAITVEFTKETLDTMLDGLGKIRDQLSSVARST